jgi:tRNA dimethylallyltransferase
LADLSRFLHFWQWIAAMADFCNLWVVVGPTASGKSDLAMALARSRSAEILSIDSMQVYRRMDIGTAKPSVADRAAVPHHLIDVVDPTESFTVARFVEAADDAIADAARRNAPLVATGGTPLYYKALFQGLFAGPGADAVIREWLNSQTGEDLHRRLAEVDPAAAARIHLNDTKRLVRALEVYELTGKPITSLQNEWVAGRSRHPAKWIGLQWDRDLLNRRINARVKAMIAAGWLEEARELIQSHGALSPTAAEATGYRELIDHINGKISLEDAIEQIKIATRQLARRQMKWFRRFPGVTWIAGDQSIEKLMKAIGDLTDRISL